MPIIPWWIFWIPRNYTIDLGHIPSYFYNFDLIDLGFMFRHLINKKENFETGIIGINQRNRFIYAGKALFSFKGMKYHNDTECYEYSISGEAFGDIIGNMFIDKEKGNIIEISMPLYNSPSFDSFLFRFKGLFNANKEEWRDFIISQTKSLRNDH